jgi:hypothetical protein
MKLDRAGLAGLLIALVAVPVASADVKVRAEGPDGTLVNTTVPRVTDPVTKQGVTCAADSAAAALNRAVGDSGWDAQASGGSLFVTRILSQSLSFGTGNDRFWGFDHNHVFSDLGICEYKPADGDELLFFAACGGPSSTACFDLETTLGITAPAEVTAGQPFTVTVRTFDDKGVPTPAAEVTVRGGDQPVTTGPDGTAQVTVSAAGTVTLVATKGRQVRDEATVKAIEYAVPPPPTAPADTTAPVSTIQRIHEGRLFRHRRKAPRTLRAVVADVSPLASVELGITRRIGQRCTAYDDTLGRFARVRCGTHPRFDIGTAKSVSLLLPQRLGRGRYTYDVRATDAAGNVERTVRRRNRVVFHVR